MRGVWFVFAVAVWVACANPDPTPHADSIGSDPCEASGEGVFVDPTREPCRKLSGYRFFRVGAKQEPNDGVLPFDVNTPLFSDYAHKYRFVWMPPGTSAHYTTDTTFVFPVGTVLLKTFTYPVDEREPAKGRRLIETRMLLHRPDGWVGLPYIWNESQTDAYLSEAGGQTLVTFMDRNSQARTFDYTIPNVNQCKACHRADGTMGPIGPKAFHLNKTFVYPEGAANQIERWTQAGYLTGAPATTSVPKIVPFDDPAGSLDARARGYLESNCAHCHNPRGPARTSGLDLRLVQNEPAQWGVCKAPVAAGRGSGGLQYDIVPGAPDASILLFRMESVDPGVMMPELGRKLMHAEGVALIRAWIAAMPGTCQ